MAKNLDYLYLRAWCALMGSFDYYLQNELIQARADGAPQDVIHSTTRERVLASPGDGDPGDPTRYFPGEGDRLWVRWGGLTDPPATTVAYMQRYLANLQATGRVHG